MEFCDPCESRSSLGVTLRFWESFGKRLSFDNEVVLLLGEDVCFRGMEETNVKEVTCCWFERKKIVRIREKRKEWNTVVDLL